MTLLRPATHIAVEERDDIVYIAPLPDGPIRVLEGIAALIWREACAGPAETIAERVLAQVEGAPGDAPSVIESLVADLRQSGMLMPGPGEPGGA